MARMTLLAVMGDPNTPSRTLTALCNYVLECATVCACKDAQTEIDLASQTQEEQAA